MDINELLGFTKKNNASDLHLVSGHPPTLRINGEIVPLRVNTLSPDEVLSMIHSIMSEKQRLIYEKELELDFAINYGDFGRFRVNAFSTINGAAAVFRDIPNKIHSIEELKLPQILEKISMLSKGLILVTGPTGSGKSTSMAAMINHINNNTNRHILTIEDPVEFIHKSNKSLINQRELGTHTKSFARALKSALREDPDVIMVGELRDKETISLALTAAETGHLVIATLHTSSAAKTIDRVIDVFPESEKAMARTMLATSLEAVITQLLIKTSDNLGRVPAIEILIANSAVRNLIRDNKIPQIYSIMQVSSKAGMRILRDSVYQFLDEGIINPEDARTALNYSEIETDENSESGKKIKFTTDKF